MPEESSSHDDRTPRWTLPPRREISPENLHISSFVVASKDTEGGTKMILLLRAGEKHPLSFRRGRLMLPATMVRYGEKPREAARRAIIGQLSDASILRDPEFHSFQSYSGAHWDIVFLFQTSLASKDVSAVPKDPFVEAAFYDLSHLPRSEMAEDHLEVIEHMLQFPEGD